MDGKCIDGLRTQLDIERMVLKVPTELLALIFISMKLININKLLGEIHCFFFFVFFKYKTLMHTL